MKLQEDSRKHNILSTRNAYRQNIASTIVSLFLTSELELDYLLIKIPRSVLLIVIEYNVLVKLGKINKCIFQYPLLQLSTYFYKLRRNVSLFQVIFTYMNYEQFSSSAR